MDARPHHIWIGGGRRFAPAYSHHVLIEFVLLDASGQVYWDNGWFFNESVPLEQWLRQQKWYKERKQSWDWMPYFKHSTNEGNGIDFGFDDLKIATEFKLRWG